MFFVSKKKYLKLEKENKRLDKENKRLDKDLNKSATKINSLIDEKKELEKVINRQFEQNKDLKKQMKSINGAKGGYISKCKKLENENETCLSTIKENRLKIEKLECASLKKDETIRSLTEENTKAHRELHEANINIEKFKNFIAKKLGRPLTTAEDVIKYDCKRPSRRK